MSTLPAFLILAATCLAQVKYAPECASALDGKLPPIVPSDFHFSGTIRTYYIQAEQETWDFMPTGWDNWLGVPLEDSPRVNAAGYSKDSGSLGLKWEKAFYRGYTDASFTQRTST
jgi:hypothetical protein